MEKEETEGRIYKYRKIDDNTKNNLINNELFFNHPEKFNDPFDSKIKVEYKGTIEDWYNWASRRGKIVKTDIDQRMKDEIIIEVENGIFEYNQTKNDKLLNGLAKNLYKICSFSGTNSSILMWSHYADNHKGICLCFKTQIVEKYFFRWDEVPGTDSERLIEFLKRKFSISWFETAKIEKIDDGKTIRISTKKNYVSLGVNKEKTKVNLKIDDNRTVEFIAKAEGSNLNIRLENNHSLEFPKAKSMPLPILFPVDYHKPKPKIINMLTLPRENKLMDFYTTKHKDWEYEQEHRQLIFDEDEREEGFTVRYRKKDLEGIIFGLKAKREEIEEIIDIISIFYLWEGIKVNFYSTHEIQDEYAIEVKKIEDIREYLEKLS